MDISSLSTSSIGVQRPDPAQMRTRLFSRTDADGSGTITKQELTDALARAPKPPSGGEAPDVEDLWTQMDSDADGEVTEAEHTQFLETTETQRGAQQQPPPPRPIGTFDGSTDMLSSLISAMEDAEETETDANISALIAKFVEALKERSTRYNADGTSTSAGATNLFQADA